jgi:hypothetical protein
MSSNADKLRHLIEVIVRREVRALVPQLVKESVMGLLAESQQAPTQGYNQPHYVPPQNQMPMANSHKRVNLQETSGEGYDAWPTMNTSNINPQMFDRSMLLDNGGFNKIGAQFAPPQNMQSAEDPYGQYRPNGGFVSNPNPQMVAPAQSHGVITVDTTTGGVDGMPMPVNPAAIPTHVLSAFNKDYRGFMDRMKSVPRMAPNGQ